MSDHSQRLTSRGTADLAIVVISTNEARWLEPCLTTVFDHAGTATLQVIVVDNSSTDGTRELVESRFPEASVVTSINRGFAHGNNRGLEHADARYMLLLNPDTEVIEGTFGELVALMDARPRVGLAGVRQVNGDGRLLRTIRRFPSASRSLGEALYSERWPIHPAWSGERVLDRDSYEREAECDWTSGSFMIARREALLGAGLLDERFFLQSEEPDLCLRIKRAGWEVRHLPQMTIVHHAGKAGVVPRMIAQDAYSRRQYAHKHFGRAHRGLYLSAIGVGHVVRAATAKATSPDAPARREGSRRALKAIAGRGVPPFGWPPFAAVAPSADGAPGAAPSAGDPPVATPSANGAHVATLSGNGAVRS
ncbi:MAG TPA: glycosyltransferase family 2 protein [Solirubrobacteraceae bacterium]|jgi:N-acetylglucosaminyl-diphospho-decaprenol L-rhamnosyltransferase|nr:glycosyltransferase family 2 protein [Solirubrobacteraceae bacterium]